MIATGNVILLPGTVLGNRVRVAHAKPAHGNIEDDASVVRADTTLK